MLNNNYYHLFLLLCYNLCISCEIISKEEVLKIKAVKCKEDKECDKSICWRGFCDNTFYCHDNECIRQTEDMTFDSGITVDNYKNSHTTTLILESCPEEVRKIEKCYTRFCEKDSNCFSNKCFNNTCIANKDITTNICEITFDKRGMDCHKLPLDSCKNDKDCHLSFCNEYNICSDQVKKENYIDYVFYAQIIIIIIIIIVVIGFILVKKFYKPSKGKINQVNK